ncbi:MAG: OsmC family protein [Gemmatimonadota bacterium]
MSFKGMLGAIFEQATRWTAGQSLEPQSAETRQVEGLRSEGRVRHHTFTIDEPKDFGGSDLAPNPAEVALAALGASLEVTCRVYADYFGIPVKAIATSLKGDLDLRGFLDLAPEVRSGFQRIDVTVRIESDASDEEVERLMRQVRRSCPVLGIVRDATPVSLSVERT